MTQEDKELLLVDLSARFPYNVAIDCKSEDSRFTCYLTTDMLREIQNNTCYWEYKPFLFPLSSMTEGQRKELQELYFDYIPDEIFNDTEFVYHYDCMHLIDWLNKNHFDYRGFIEKGLAIDATNKNIY